MISTGFNLLIACWIIDVERRLQSEGLPGSSTCKLLNYTDICHKLPGIMFLLFRAV